MNERTNRTIANLKQNGFTVKFFDTADAAKKAILEDAASYKSAAFGGSVTVDKMGIYEALSEKGLETFWHWKSDDRVQALMDSRSADIYFTGCNAITESGSLVNIDGTGNRLSGILYGHKHVFMVTGTNKIAGSYEEALLRIKNHACPLNANRLELKTPCAASGKCENCVTPLRMCCATLIIDRQTKGTPLTIYLIDEVLGF